MAGVISSVSSVLCLALLVHGFMVHGRDSGSGFRGDHRMITVSRVTVGSRGHLAHPTTGAVLFDRLQIGMFRRGHRRPTITDESSARMGQALNCAT